MKVVNTLMLYFVDKIKSPRFGGEGETRKIVMIVALFVEPRAPVLATSAKRRFS
jgi:hypothetical protein